MGKDRRHDSMDDSDQREQMDRESGEPLSANGERAHTGSRERNETIGEITCLLAGMNEEQLQNMHTYAVDEYYEPNHEAEALEAVVQLSRKYRKKNEE